MKKIALKEIPTEEDELRSLERALFKLREQKSRPILSIKVPSA